VKEFIEMYAILDIETTGGKYDEEGITEIAIYRFDGYKIIDQFCSLINPEKEIQPFVIKLTGINNKMLRSAPKFFEVAKRIIEITKDCILVAHNAEFDYRILQTEFRRLGFTFERRSICTVKLSRILLPEQTYFSLGKLVSNLGIPFVNQHRANEDARVTLKLFQILLERDTHKNILKKNIRIHHPNKAPIKFLNIIDNLPSEMGVYYIHNKKNEIIYIGKSRNIKKKVLRHLTGTNKKAKTIQNIINNVTFALTGGELITILKEQNEIKINDPILNSRAKFLIFPMGIRIDFFDKYPYIISEQIKRNQEYLCVYKNKKEIKEAILNFVDEFNISINKTNLSKADKEAYLYKNQICNDFYEEDSPDKYQKKINSLIQFLSYPNENFLIIQKGRLNGEFSFVYIENYKLLGYGYFELNHQIKTKDQILSRLVSIEESSDSKKLIHNFLSKKKYLKLIPL
tara:strand:- start:2899 stop:4272 length:1374 start_codon:yes stop_codon:yes gene_type:complete